MNADKLDQIPRLLYAMLSIFMAAFIAAPACAQNAFNHIVVVIEENHDYNQVIGNPSAPVFNALANYYGVATQYYANTHPSIGNYFMLTTGQILTNEDGKIPSSFPVSADNIVRHLIASGRSWKSYAEDLPAVGQAGNDFNNYAVRHNPFAYFTDVQNDSTQRNNLVPFADPNAGFAHDLANNSLPNYSFIIPNLCNDAHDCALSVADTWLLTNLGPLFRNATLMQDTLVIFLFDEADTDSTDGGGKVYWVAAGPNVKPSYVSSTLYQHQSTLRETLEGLGLPYNLAAAATAPSMGEFFKPVRCTTTCDTTPPSVPTGLTATSVGGSQVILSWTASTDPDSPVAGYNVYRNGNPNPIGTTAVATYTDNTVSPGTTYTYTAAAYDPANNLSAQSLPVTVTTACPSCPPSVPTGLTATSVSSSQVSLSWTDADSTVAGYQIYRDGNVINTTTATSYTDNTVSAGTTYTYTVAAYNAAGVPSAQSLPVTVTTPCPLCGTSGQHPALLASYATRPPWQVAGVDYAVGVPSTATLTDWQLLSGPGISVNTTGPLPYVRVDNTSNVVISGVDFSLHGGAVVFFINSPNPTVTGSQFGGPNLVNATASLIFSDYNSPGLTVSYNTIDGGGMCSGSSLVGAAGANTTTLTYNWLKNFSQHVLEMLVNGSSSSVVYKYNLIEKGGTCPGSGLNYLQFGGSANYSPVDVEYNTSYQTWQATGGEGYQFGSYGTALIQNVTLAYNVMIAAGSPIVMTYMVHGGGSQNAGIAHDNYIDPTASYGWLYNGSFTGWNFSNNYDMTTGAIQPGSS